MLVPLMVFYALFGKCDMSALLINAIMKEGKMVLLHYAPDFCTNHTRVLAETSMSAQFL